MNQDEVHAQFDQFDWAHHEEFQAGLAEILDNHLAALQEQDSAVTAIPAAERQQLTDQAKLFFFCTSTGHILNLDEYYAWKRRNKIVLVEETVKGTEPGATETGREAQTNPESHPNSDGQTDGQGESHEPAGSAPYSSNYQNLVDLIVSGKPVPGIKDIPDTVLSEQQSAPQAAARPKPWELLGELKDAELK